MILETPPRCSPPPKHQRLFHPDEARLVGELIEIRFRRLDPAVDIGGDNPKRLSADAFACGLLWTRHLLSPSCNNSGVTAEIRPPEAPKASRARTETDRSRWNRYRAGEKLPSGDTIADILQRTEKCIVFINQDGNPQWEYSASCVDGNSSSSIASGLFAQINASIADRRVRRRAIGIVCDALAYALDSRRRDDQRDFFDQARLMVETLHVEALHVTYLAASATATMAVISVLMLIRFLLPDPVAKLFFLCASLSALGALFSVWLRFRTIPIEPFMSLRYTAAASISRIVVGAISGAVFLFFQRAGLVMAVLQNDAVTAFAFVAGFSERVVPELLSAFETKIAAEARKAISRPILAESDIPAKQSNATSRKPGKKKRSTSKKPSKKDRSG
jgi:hypothetical protein